MCQHGNVVGVEIGGRIRDIDACLALLVKALNDGGFATVASCCGHGHCPGNIALADGRELCILPDYAAGRLVDRTFGVDIHGEEMAGAV